MGYLLVSPSISCTHCTAKDATAERAKMQLHIQDLHLKFSDLYRSALVWMPKKATSPPKKGKPGHETEADGSQGRGKGGAGPPWGV